LIGLQDVVDVAGLSEGQLVAYGKTLADRIAACRPQAVHASAFTRKSLLPFKAASIQEVLIHRISELAQPTAELYDRGRLVPAFVLTRSVVETTALMYVLHRQLKEFLTSHNEDAFDAFLMRALLGSRGKAPNIEALNVLTTIDHVDNDFAGLRRMYDELCEFTHPNLSGTLSAFGDLDHEKYILTLGYRAPSLMTGIGPFLFALLIFAAYYDDSSILLQGVNAYLDKQSAA
jgi:hypothetical protein